MKPSTKHVMSTSGSLLDMSDNLSDNPTEDHILKSIDGLEVRIYRVFSEIEQQLNECEMELISSVKKVFHEIRDDNVECMEAVQLDLEVLRQRVLYHEFDCSGDPLELLDTLPPSSILHCAIQCGGAELRAFLSERTKLSFKLPTASLHLNNADAVSASAECLKFETPKESEKKTTFAVDEPEKESELRTSAETPKRTSRRTKSIAKGTPTPDSKQQRSGRYGLPAFLLMSTATALTAGVLVHQAVSRLSRK